MAAACWYHLLSKSTVCCVACCQAATQTPKIQQGLPSQSFKQCAHYPWWGVNNQSRGCPGGSWYSFFFVVPLFTKASVSSLESSCFSKYSGAPQGHHVIFPAKGPPPAPSPIYIIVIYHISYTSSTAQGGGGSFKNRKPIGEVGCCESGMAERSHWWTERCLVSSLSLSFSDYLPTYLPIYLSICLCIYLSIDLSLSLSSI